MIRFKRRLLSVMLASSMIFTLAGCGSSSNKTAGGKATTTVKDDGTIDTSQPVTVKLLVLGDKPTNGRGEAAVEKLNEKLKEKVNAELELQYVEWADWQTQYNLLLASGDDSIDLITTATDWLDAWPNVKKGSFLPLSEDMLKTYAPETFNTVSQEHWDQCKYKDEIYLIPEDNYTQYTNHGFF
ncbi:MAG: extracellular solute-binding protein, partial [Clostridium sp.]|nr:extracellular solute-binding protein [Clostridium sp.]